MEKQMDGGTYLIFGLSIQVIFTHIFRKHKGREDILEIIGDTSWRFTLEIFTGVRSWRSVEEVNSPLHTNETGQRGEMRCELK